MEEERRYLLSEKILLRCLVSASQLADCSTQQFIMHEVLPTSQAVKFVNDERQYNRNREENSAK